MAGKKDELEEDLHTGFEAEDNKEFIEEDKQVEVIENLKDDEEIQATIEIIEEELEEMDEPEKKDTSPAQKEEPGDNAHLGKEKDTSETKVIDDDPLKTGEPGAVESVEAEAKRLAEDEARAKELAEKFILSDEEINKQPENVRAILTKYKGQGKQDLAKAAANAIALNNPHLKDNEKAIKAVAEKIDLGTTEEVMSTLIDSQKSVGLELDDKKTTPEEQEDYETIPKELPPLPEDNEEVTTAVNTQVMSKLKEKYPDMPEDMKSPDFTEWRRDLNDDNPDNDFKDDLKTAKGEITNGFQKAIYLKENYRSINNNLLVKEVESIKAELKKYNIDDPKDIGLDLSLVKDEKGSLFNKALNDLMLTADGPDPIVVTFVGNIPVLQKGQLMKKFIYNNNPAILSHIANISGVAKDKEIERLKDANLNTLGVNSSSGHNVGTIKIEDIQKMSENEDELEKTLAEIENSL